MSWFDEVPKVELHVHLEGAIPYEGLFDLIRKYGGDPSVPDVAALAKRFQYKDFSQFIAAWSWKNKFLRAYEDFTRALLLAELTGMFHVVGLREMRTAFYKVDVELEKLLAASCTQPGDAQAVRKIFADDLGVDRLGVGARRQDDGIHFAFPIVVVAGQKQAA
jgi:hypothetical protein